MTRRITPERWARIESVLDAALDRSPDERGAFLDRACDGDPGLRREVASLLEAHERSGAIDRIAAEVIAPLMARLESPDIRRDGQTLGRYEILERLGGGGMGVLYTARDTRLHRTVALKFLLPQLGADRSAKERFMLEARAAAALDHPNVCTIYEIGETADGQLFIAMPFYEGETLRSRISCGPLPIAEALAIALQMARGLAKAHEHGIVHRDVKPSNVLVTGDGVVKIVDFGIAKLADVTLTAGGALLGTPAYMSPEQARGEAVDQRTDVWSLGVVLYEMLAGRNAFPGDDADAIRSAILGAAPEPLAVLRPDVPPALDRIARRALAKEREARYGSMRELEHDLRALGAPDIGSGASAVRALPERSGPALASTSTRGRRLGVLTLAAAAVASLVFAADRARVRGGNSAPAATATPGAVQHVVVADFANYTSDSLLADAVSHALRIDLARAPGVRVAGAATVTGALRRMRREPNARLSSELAREVAVREGIRGVIDGEVREAGGGYVISAAIVEAATGEAVDGWRESARDRAGVIPAIDGLSAAIRERVGKQVASLKPAERLWHSTTSSLEALRTFSRAERIFQRGDFLGAATLLEEAIRMDSSFAHAHFLLAISLISADVRRDRALKAIARAYQLRDRLSDPERHAITAVYNAKVVGDLPKAIKAFRNHIEAAKAGGGDFFMYASLGDALAQAGDLPGAEAVLREARSVWPTPVNQGALVRLLYRRGKVAEAIAVLREAMERYPAHPDLMRLQAELSIVSGDYAAADALASELPSGAGLGYAHRIQALNAAVQGRIEDAIGHFRAMRQEQLSAGLTAAAADVTAAIGRLHLVRGDPRAALAEVEGFLAREPLDSLDPLDRPHLLLARFFAEAGRPARALGILGAYDREVPQEFRGSDRWSYLRTRAAIYLAEGEPRAALAHLERASREPPIGERFLFGDDFIPIAEGPELARAYDRAGDADSAIATYERYLATRSTDRIRLDAFELPGALIRLAELYEARGDRAAAARHYLRFAELWEDADAALQPRVREARTRAAELTRLAPQKLQP